ncbi:MAG TPA: PEGA domain-containing protein [Crenotrichaceae bacterium]|nr:PEGA domain-containing protein [Crenotrichaceae bacterium]
MNTFNQQLLEAKKRQRLRYIRTFIFLVLGVLIVLSAILASRGTRIKVLPDDAAELATVHRHQGIAVVIGDTVYSLSTHPAIAVSAQGFKPLVQVLSENNFGQVMTVTLQPLPAKLELSTTVDDEVNWLINDKTVAIASTLKHELAAGDYQLTVTHPYYQDTTLALSLARDELFNKVISLSPIEGSVAIKTIPAGAHISIDGIDQGLSPLNLPLQGGVRAVNVRLDNYEPVDDTIEIKRQRADVQREYNLELKKAVVNLSLKPQAGQLRLDAIPLQATHQIRVTTGIKHTLSYAKPGYFTQSRTFNLAADETLDVGFALKKETGRVDIKSSPAAEVVLNGKPVGTTPLQLSVDAIKQTITLHKPGFRSVTRQITPSAAAPVTINVSLLDEKTARLREARPFYTHKAGGVLKLFTPNDTFTMGAKRSERGQRANEFVRTITLNKAFYAGVDEVTIAEYRQFNHSVNGQPQLPVTSVSWMDAAQFCNWLSQKEGLQAVYRINNKQLTAIIPNADGYRLLTEAEWEWLARKAGKTRQTRFVWGDDSIVPKNAANIADESALGSVKFFVSKYNDGYPGVAPVRRFTREASGLYDQGGNVSEWTHDSYSLIHSGNDAVLNNPFDQSISAVHVVKGANWRSGSVTELRASFRQGLAESRETIGFRIGRYIYGEK